MTAPTPANAITIPTVIARIIGWAARNRYPSLASRTIEVKFSLASAPARSLATRF